MSRAKRRVGWVAAVLFAAAATLTGMLLQAALRDTWQVRSLPERVMEWLLLFVPLDLFESGLARLGSNAKEIALAGTMAGMVAILFGLGVLVLRAGWSEWRLLGLGLALWLVGMVVVMPV